MCRRSTRPYPADLAYKVHGTWLIAAVACAALLRAGTSSATTQELPQPPTRFQPELVFTDYPAISRSNELARRILSPLTNVEIARASTKSSLRLQPIDLSRETFGVFVPHKQPPEGYGLLVFIPPWQKAQLPVGWAAALDEHGIIFVSASKSGNEESVIDRRIPLALLGAYNIIVRYPVNNARVYIGGFSGGSRVALRVALAYPDVFRGALLNAGSDPIGDGDLWVPPAELFEHFRKSTRLVYVTGYLDTWNMQHDMGSRDSMQEWCAFGTSIETMPRAGHEVASSLYLSRAFAALDRPMIVNAENLSACEERVANELQAKLHDVNELLDHNKPQNGWRLLIKIDNRYGALGSPWTTELEQRIGSQR